MTLIDLVDFAREVADITNGGTVELLMLPKSGRLLITICWVKNGHQCKIEQILDEYESLEPITGYVKSVNS